MINSLHALLPAIMFAAFVALGCSDDENAPPIATVTPGGPEIVATYGAFDPLASTPAPTTEFVLESMTCDAGVFTMVTSSGSFTGAMDCTAMPPPLVIAAFGTKPIGITVSNARLKIQAAGAGTLDLPVANASFEPR